MCSTAQARPVEQIAQARRLSYVVFLLVGSSLFTLALLERAQATQTACSVPSLLEDLQRSHHAIWSRQRAWFRFEAHLNPFEDDVLVSSYVSPDVGRCAIMLWKGLWRMRKTRSPPLTVTPNALRRDAVVVIAASSLFVALAWSSGLGRVDAMILLLALASYLVWAYRSERGHTNPVGEAHLAEKEEKKGKPRPVWWSVWLRVWAYPEQ